MTDVHPVFLDGPWAGEDWPVPASQIEQGQVTAGRDQVYTFTRVQLFDRVVVVASTSGTIPDQAALFTSLASDAAKRAVEPAP
jgi:hypothetical protein